LQTDIVWKDIEVLTPEQRTQAYSSVAAMNMKKLPGGHTTDAKLQTSRSYSFYNGLILQNLSVDFNGQKFIYFSVIFPVLARLLITRVGRFLSDKRKYVNIDIYALL
jgi:hypothetical protein